MKDNYAIPVYIFEGFRLVEKRIHNVWYKLEVPCNQCGECCKRVPSHWWLGVNEKGHCRYLRKEEDKYWCRANDIPFGCRSGDEEDKEWCCVKWHQQ